MSGGGKLGKYNFSRESTHSYGKISFGLCALVSFEKLVAGESRSQVVCDIKKLQVHCLEACMIVVLNDPFLRFLLIYSPRDRRAVRGH